MNVLVLTTDYPPIEGGIATVALNLCRELHRANHVVTVIAPHFPGQRAFDKAEGYTVRRFRGYRLGWARIVPMALTALFSLREADLILAINASHGGVFAMLARPVGGPPYIAFGYAFEFLRFQRAPGFAALLRRVYNRALAVVPISAFTQRTMSDFGVNLEKMRVILPGAPAAQTTSAEHVDRVRHTHLVDDGPILLSVGRLIPRKGHTTLVRALPLIAERFPDVTLIVVGRGPQLSPITRLANELAVRGRIRFAGHLNDEDVAALYHACTLFVLPTGAGEGGHVEGFGLVFTEANAYGKAVVAGRSGGTVDAVLHNETGLLVEPNDPGALAEAVIALLADPPRAAAMGAAGKRRVEEDLNWTRFTEQLMALAAERGVS